MWKRRTQSDRFVYKVDAVISSNSLCGPLGRRPCFYRFISQWEHQETIGGNAQCLSAVWWMSHKTQQFMPIVPFCAYTRDFSKPTSLIFGPAEYRGCSQLFHCSVDFICHLYLIFLLWFSRCGVLRPFLLHYKWRGEGSEPQSRLQVRKNCTIVASSPALQITL